MNSPVCENVCPAHDLNINRVSELVSLGREPVREHKVSIYPEGRTIQPVGTYICHLCNAIT